MRNLSVGLCFVRRMVYVALHRAWVQVPNLPNSFCEVLIIVVGGPSTLST
jgi:hypothetical protein